MMHEFQSADKQFGLRISDDNLLHLIRFCAQYTPKETGGILIGHYSFDLHWAEIDEIAGPPQDSIHHALSFVRGNRCMLSKLNRLWRKTQYYLGEWHYHPNASPIPSSTDKQAMYAISQNKNLFCPEPILLIVGGRAQNWLLYVSVFANNSEITLDEIICK